MICLLQKVDNGMLHTYLRTLVKFYGSVLLYLMFDTAGIVKIAPHHRSFQAKPNHRTPLGFTESRTLLMLWCQELFLSVTLLDLP